jgi:hypothetical protein
VGKSGAACGLGRRMESGGTRKQGSSAHGEVRSAGPRRATKTRLGLGLGRDVIMFEGGCQGHETAPTRRVSEEWERTGSG